MADVDLTREEALEVHAAATAAFVDLVRAMPIDPSPVRSLHWSTIEVGAHVLAGQRSMLDMMHGHGGWQSIYASAEENERLLAATRERRPGEVARALGEVASELHDTWSSSSAELVLWHGGIKVPIETVIAVNAADVLVHGWDIARALQRPWEISPEAATVAIAGSLAIATHFASLHAEHVDVVYLLRLKTGREFTITIAHGDIDVSSGRTQRPDCKIAADPVAFLLVGAHRKARFPALVTGKIRASGRRPWLGPQFASLIDWP